jgi:hypothetical protein
MKQFDKTTIFTWPSRFKEDQSRPDAQICLVVVEKMCKEEKNNNGDSPIEQLVEGRIKFHTIPK